MASRIPMAGVEFQALVQVSKSNKSVFKFKNHIGSISKSDFSYNKQDSENTQILQTTQTIFSK